MCIWNATTCWWRSVRKTRFPWIERDVGIEFDQWDMPKVDTVTLQSTNPKVFFGGDAAFGPKNIIWAVAHGHDAAVSIDLFCNGKDVKRAPLAAGQSASQKMGIHEWSYDNDVSLDLRFKVPHAPKELTLRNVNVEVELGFDRELAFKEAQRCLNCDVETVFENNLCIECDACVDICPMDCITFTPNDPEPVLRTHLTAPTQQSETQDLYVSDDLKTGRVMVKDEDVCLHCGLCAERCPTGAWDMKKFYLETAKACDRVGADGNAHRRHQRFRRQIRQRQRFGLGDRQRTVRALHPAHGRAGVFAQHLPVEHSGPADLV